MDESSLRARKTASIALSLAWLGTLLFIASVVMRGLAVMRPPWGNMFEFATAGAAAASLAYCLLARRRHWEWLGLFVIGPVLLTLGLAMFAFYTEAAELMPALKSVWLVIHVVVAFLAVAVFTIGFSVGIVYLVKRRREEHPPARPNFVETLPPAASLERTAYGLNMVGFILWTFTLVAGAIWAQKAWSLVLDVGPEGGLDVRHLGGLRGVHARARDGRVGSRERRCGSRWPGTSACC